MSVIRPLDKVFPQAVPSFVNFPDMLETLNERLGTLPKYFFGGFRNPIGVEVEMENVPNAVILYFQNGLCWRPEQDPSLKHKGLELVSRPLSGHVIDYALAEFSKVVPPSVQYNHRCSVHVHLNMSGFNTEQLNNFLTYYVLLEGALFSYCDPVRKSNSYCIPLTDLSPKEVTPLDPYADMKYHALNFETLCRYLTVEIRIHEGTHDIKKLRRWLQICCKLHRYAMSNNPMDDVKQLLRGDYSLYARMFGPHEKLFSKQELQDSAQLGLEWLFINK